MKRKKLNPVYWAFQILGGMIAFTSIFWIPALVCKILGG